MACPSPRVQCTAGEVTLTEIIAAVNAIGCERGGIYWEAAVSYIKGDIIVEDDTFTEAWICSVNHTSATGDNVNGAPSQGLSVVWEYIIPDHGVF